METFDKHIVNVLNRVLENVGDDGEFVLTKSYRPGHPALYKEITVKLFYHNRDLTELMYTGCMTLPLQTNDIERGYNLVLEDLLYKLLYDSTVWNSISTKLGWRVLHSRIRTPDEL